MVIPNIVHFVFGLRTQTSPFTFMSYMAIRSAIVVNRPEKVNFIYHYEPFGYWWTKIKPYLTMVHVPLITSYKSKEIKQHQHMADIYRLQFLLKEGGIYLDIDTISIKPWHALRHSDKPMIMAEEYDYGLCNAVMLAEPDAEFIKIWLDVYDKHFKLDGWVEASVFLPKKIAEVYVDLIGRLPQSYFFYPGCREFDMIFKEIPHREISEHAISLHLWNTMNKSLCDFINPGCLVSLPKIMYSELIRRAVSYMTSQEIIEFDSFSKLYFMEPQFNNALIYGYWRNFEDANEKTPFEGKHCSLEATTEVREFLESFDEKLDTVLDLGCGSCHWFSTTPQFKNAVAYKGIDCSMGLLELVIYKYPASNYMFYLSNLKTTDVKQLLNLTHSDLCVLYNVLEHNSIADSKTILSKVFELSSKYILVSSSEEENTELSDLFIAVRNVEKLGIDPSYEIKHRHPKFLLLSKRG